MLDTMRLLCDTTTCVSHAGSEGVCCSDHLLVEESSAPDLTGNECAAEDTDKEPQGNEAFRSSDQASHGSGNRAYQQQADED